jgi:hypothetical protein
MMRTNGMRTTTPLLLFFDRAAETRTALVTEHVHASFLLFEVVLLRAYDAARSADA